MTWLWWKKQEDTRAISNLLGGEMSYKVRIKNKSFTNEMEKKDMKNFRMERLHNFREIKGRNNIIKSILEKIKIDEDIFDKND